MEEISIKSHLIIKDIHEEYEIDWCGKLFGSNPEIKNGKPVFIIIGDKGRMEANTMDMHQLEDCAKMLTTPRGRSAITKDSSRIYLKEVGGNEKLIGVLVHKRVKTFAPMYDKVGYR